MMVTQTAARSSDWAYIRDLGRAFGGALLFSLPLLMTMEMWALGFGAPPERRLIYLLRRCRCCSAWRTTPASPRGGVS